MNISELSIRRPVLATVLTIIILLFGFIGYSYLGVREYPSVDNPIISVSCSYPGANADVIENQITEPLEQNINGIPGIRSLSSVSQQGQSRITVEFELSVDLETAANDVRDKVSRAQRYLPRDCDPPTVSKADADAMPILMVALQSDKRSLLELSEIADLTVKEQLQTISDVSSVSIWGEKRYSMRLWLDPVKMAGYGITPIDVKNAVDNENVELPSGSIEGNTTELTIRTLGLMHTADEFNDLIVKEDNNRIVRFSDIGRAELGPADLKAIYIRSSNGDMIQLDNLIELENGIAPPKLYRYNRFVSATISAGLADGKTIGQGLDEMDKIAKETLDDTFRTALSGDSKEYRESSSSLMFAFILAILLIYLILAAQFESFKDPLIIMLTVPLAIAGALVFMYFGDITMNIFSQIGIIMLIGLVAKNGILIVEFANQKQEAGEDKMSAIKDAALQRLRPILMTSASTVLGLIPLAFASGEGANQRIAMGTAVVGGMVVSTLLTMYIVPAIYSYISTNRIKITKE